MCLKETKSLFSFNNNLLMSQQSPRQLSIVNSFKKNIQGHEWTLIIRLLKVLQFELMSEDMSHTP